MLSQGAGQLLRLRGKGEDPILARTPSGSQRTTTTNEPMRLVPFRKRVGTIHFVKSPLVTACLVTRL